MTFMVTLNILQYVEPENLYIVYVLQLGGQSSHALHGGFLQRSTALLLRGASTEPFQRQGGAARALPHPTSNYDIRQHLGNTPRLDGNGSGGATCVTLLY